MRNLERKKRQETGHSSTSVGLKRWLSGWEHSLPSLTTLVDSQNPCHGKRDPAPASCPLTSYLSTHSLRIMSTCWRTHTYNKMTKVFLKHTLPITHSMLGKCSLLQLLSISVKVNVGPPGYPVSMSQSMMALRCISMEFKVVMWH